MIKIGLLGDIAVFDNGLLGKDWRKILQDVRELLLQYDIVVANLEAPITEIKKTNVYKGIHLKTSKKIIELLKYLNVTHVNLGNNHIYDFGEKGVEDTVKLLRDNGIHYFGIGTAPEYIDIDNNIVFHSFCCYSTNGAGYGKPLGGVVPLTHDNVRKGLQSDRINKRTSIMFFHWGDEYSYYPNAKQVDFVHNLTREYRFVIHGTHTHVIQGIEEIDGSICAYNSGNFLMDAVNSAIDDNSKILQSRVNRESFLLTINLEQGKIIGYETKGTFFSGDRFDFIDNRVLIKELSEIIKDCRSEGYKKKSQQMIKEVKEINLGKRNINWLISKLNVNSIAAKIKSFYYKEKYKRAY